MRIRLKSEGICGYCKGSFHGNTIARHLVRCHEMAKANNKCGNNKIYIIKAEAYPYWVYFEANASDTLSDIDNFLRGLWLECCGHLSAFTIDGIVYSSHPEKEFADKSMDIQIGKAIAPGLSFSHEYDFGSTTFLRLKCLSDRLGEILKKIKIIARNEMPDFKCVCGNKPESLCLDCFQEKGYGAMLCKKCEKEHECDEEMFLPIVNSPRMGVCGYSG